MNSFKADDILGWKGKK